jgi:tetratricopeptide (TPR) repeat protein
MATDPSPRGGNADLAQAAAGGQSGLVRAYCADADMLLSQERLEEARAVVKQALRLAPRDAAALNILGVIDLQKGDLKSAAATIKRAVDLQPGAPEPRHYLGLAYEYMGRYDDAIESFRAALALRPGVVATLRELGKLLKFLGRQDEAKDALLRLLEADPGDTGAFFALAEFAPQALTTEHLSRLDKIADDPAAHIRRRAMANFALALVHEARGEFDAEFTRLRHANDLSRDHLTRMDGRTESAPIMPPGARPRFTTPAKALAQLADMRSFVETTFDADFIRRHEGAGHPSNLPIFIVGMLRSGSSLIEQILSCHPMVHGAGEIDTFEAKVVAMQWPYEGYLYRDADGALRPSEPPPRHFRIRGAEYVKAVRELNPRARRVVNKYLANYLNIGMIHLCLPGAIIIHSARDPVDTCLGCYKRNFETGNETTYDLALLGQHYQEYRKVMAHWQRVLPGRVVDVVYEELVADPEGQIRRLLELCGLPWDERCLRSHENPRPVQTASSIQVRRPIYRGALQRWRRYEKHLTPLFEALGPYAPPRTGQ